MSRHQALIVRRTSERGTSPTLSLACALLLSAFGAGCERGVAPPQAGPAEPGQPPSATVPASSASDAPSQLPVPDPNAKPAAAVPAVGEIDGPAPTVGTSSADATRKGEGTPILRAVRTGQHPGVDRLVFEFDGPGLPAWQVEYVDRPVRDCGSGEPVPVAGEAWLQIQFDGAQAHTDAGAPTSGPRRRTLNQPVLRELVRTCDFEGQVTWVVGVAKPNAYTPRILTTPSRLVIDIAH